MTRYLEAQPELDPVELTYLSEWTDDTTDAEIVAAWSETLGLELSGTIWDAAATIAADPRYSVYLGINEPFVEIYRTEDLPPDTEYEED